MNDYSLAEVFDCVYKQEFLEFEHSPKHIFSHRHRKAMKKILYPHSFQEPVAKRHIPLKRRLLIAAVAIILMGLGITAGATIIRGFTRKEHRDNTQIFAVNAENSPKTIEYVYYLPNIPDGYKLFEQITDPNWHNTSYINSSSNKMIAFDQHVKMGFSAHLDNEHNPLEEIEIDGKYALYIEDESGAGGEIIWDNEDYILSVSGSFSKEKLIALAESVEVKKK